MDAIPDVPNYRTHSNTEVGFLLKIPAGKIVGVEVKVSLTVDARQLAGKTDTETPDSKAA